jgi:predicted nucleic-acid-binding Zn-ribbon protein
VIACPRCRTPVHPSAPDCPRCGLVEPARAQPAPRSIFAGFDEDPRAGFVEPSDLPGYRCTKCGHESCEAGDVSLGGDSWLGQGMLTEQFAAVTCRSCRYTELYRCSFEALRANRRPPV